MRCALAFSRSTADHFIVTLELPEPPTFATLPKLSVTPYGDENEFIQRAVLAVLDDDVISEIIAAVLLFVADRLPPNSWTFVDLSNAELQELGMAQPKRPGMETSEIFATASRQN